MRLLLAARARGLSTTSLARPVLSFVPRGAPPPPRVVVSFVPPQQKRGRGVDEHRVAEQEASRRRMQRENEDAQALLQDWMRARKRVVRRKDGDEERQEASLLAALGGEANVVSRMRGLRCARSTHEYEQAVACVADLAKEAQSLEFRELAMQVLLNTVRTPQPFREACTTSREEDTRARDLAMKLFMVLAPAPPPTALMCELAVIAEARAGNADAMIALVEHLLHVRAQEQHEGIIHAYITCARVYFDDVDAAYELALRVIVPRPSAYVFNQVMLRHARHMNFDRVHEVLVTMRSMNVEPDVVTRNVLAKAFGRTALGYDMLLEMGLGQEKHLFKELLPLETSTRKGQDAPEKHRKVVDLHELGASESRVAVLHALCTTEGDMDLVIITGKGHVTRPMVEKFLKYNNVSFTVVEENTGRIHVSSEQLKAFARKLSRDSANIRARQMIFVRYIALTLPALTISGVASYFTALP